MAVTTVTITDVYTNTETIKTALANVSRQLTAAEKIIQDLKTQIDKLQSLPMMA